MIIFATVKEKEMYSTGFMQQLCNCEAPEPEEIIATTTFAPNPNNEPPIKNSIGLYCKKCKNSIFKIPDTKTVLESHGINEYYQKTESELKG